MKFFNWIGDRLETMIKEVDSSNIPILNFGNYKKNSNKGDFFIYQSEGLHLKYKFTNEYKSYLDNAKQVFDYSKNNIKHYPRAIHLPLTLGIIKPLNDVDNCAILLYGAISARRTKIINELKNFGYVVDVITNVWGDELFKRAKNYKYIISVGYYDNITNDCFRIIPAVENGHIVIAERTENWFNEYLIKNCSNRIIFFNYNSIISDIKKIKIFNNNT